MKLLLFQFLIELFFWFELVFLKLRIQKTAFKTDFN